MGCNSILLSYCYLFWCSDSSSFGYQKLLYPIWVGSSFLLIYPIFLKFHFKYFLTQDVPGSSYIYPAPTLKSTTFSRGSGSFYRGLIVRNQDLGPRCAHCNWDITASRPCQQTELWNIRVNANPCTHSHIYFRIYLCV